MRPLLALVPCVFLALCAGGFFMPAALSPAPAFAQSSASSEDPYLKEYRVRAGRRMTNTNQGLSTGGRIGVEDSAAALAAEEEALRKKAEKKAAEAARKKQAAAPANAVPCQSLEDLLKIIVGQRRLGYLADAVDNGGTVHMWFVSNVRREWVSITVAQDLTACITAEGSAWNYALEPMKSGANLEDASAEELPAQE